MDNRQGPLFGHNLAANPITVGSPLTLQASGTTSDRIRALANTNGVSESELVKLAIALMQVYTSATKEGKHLAVIDANGNVIEEIAGP